MNSLSVTERLLQMHPSQVRGLFVNGGENAVQWVSLLAFEGMPQAQLCYGQMLLEGMGITKDEHAGFSWFKRAAAQGDLDAINMVGRCLENGWGCSVDITLASTYYQRAADAGHGWAQYNLGHLYLDGLGVIRDHDKAYSYYLKAAEQGHARAMNLVGRCAEQGWGTLKDRDAAGTWYRRSAEAGYFRGQYNWASFVVVNGRRDEAISWLQKATVTGTPAVREASRRLLASLGHGLPSSAPSQASGAAMEGG